MFIFNIIILQFQFIRYTELDNSNTALKKRERVLYDRISHRSPILEQFIKNRKGLGDMLDKYEDDILTTNTAQSLPEISHGQVLIAAITSSHSSRPNSPGSS